jgi:hypothetical protein
MIHPPFEFAAQSGANLQTAVGRGVYPTRAAWASDALGN